MIEDEGLFEKYNTIWKKVSADIKKASDSQFVYNKKFFKTKIKSYGDETTNFHGKEILNTGSDYTCLASIKLF